jgi:hypothetical protein
MALPALPIGKSLQKYIYLGQIDEFKRKKIHISSKPKNTRVACHDTPDTNEARGLKHVRDPWISLRLTRIGFWFGFGVVSEYNFS